MHLSEYKIAEHRLCFENYLGKNFHFFLETDYSFLYSNSKIIVKLPKSCSVWENLENIEDELRVLSYTEYQRGLRYSPSIYIDVVDIPCVYKNRHICNAAIMMKHLPQDWRLDKVAITSSSQEIIKTGIVESLNYIFNHSKKIENCDYLPHIYRGFEEINRQINTIKNSNRINMIWKNHIIQSKELESIIDFRHKNEMVRELHGDLSFSNMFWNGKKILSIDPCNSPFLYQIDVLYQLADLAVECNFYGLKQWEDWLLNPFMNYCNWDEKVFNLFFERYSLIRGVFSIKNKNISIGQKYLEQVENRYDYFN